MIRYSFFRVNSHAAVLLAVVLSLATLFATPCSGGDEDPFIREIKDAARKNNRDISEIAQRYVPPGTPVAEALSSLEFRGFKVYDTKPEQWGRELQDGKKRYLAKYKWNANVYILVTANVVLATDDDKVTEISGKIHLTGF